MLATVGAGSDIGSRPGASAEGQPEALFALTDLCGLSPDEAIASAVHTARTLTAAATR
jgi:hypothetical protein